MEGITCMERQVFLNTIKNYKVKDTVIGSVWIENFFLTFDYAIKIKQKYLHKKFKKIFIHYEIDEKKTY